MTRQSKLLRWSIFYALIFAVAPPAFAQWNEQVLYSFQGLPDGATPVGGMVFDKQGNLYGATSEGGSSACAGAGQCGTVFQLAPPAKQGDPWTETVLYVFKGRTYGDGGTPAGGLIIDASGNLYGTTAYNGTGTCTLLGSVVGCGTVYELSPPAQPSGAWTESVLYSFKDLTDGYFPQGDLVFDSAGNLYGATQFGGGKGTNCNSLYGYCGTVFELSPPNSEGDSWTENVLHSFAGATEASATGDGAAPNGGLVLDSEGNIYGTTYYGGSVIGLCDGGVGGTGCGTVFELTPPSGMGGEWGETTLYRFRSNPDGGNPDGGVVLDEMGNLYGTTVGGGDNGNGTIFELEHPPEGSKPWTEKLLYRFTGENDGAQPRAGVTLGPKGQIYGTASSKGAFRSGDVFTMISDSAIWENVWAAAVLYSFTGHSNGFYPDAKLVFDRSGSLYSTTLYGGAGQNCGTDGCGTIFRATP